MQPALTTNGTRKMNLTLQKQKIGVFEKHSDKEGLPFQTGTFTKVNYTVRRDNGTPPYPPTKFRQVCLQGDGFQNFSVVPFTVRHNLCAEFFCSLVPAQTHL